MSVFSQNVSEYYAIYNRYLKFNNNALQIFMCLIDGKLGHDLANKKNIFTIYINSFFKIYSKRIFDRYFFIIFLIAKYMHIHTYP